MLCLPCAKSRCRLKRKRMTEVGVFQKRIAIDWKVTELGCWECTSHCRSRGYPVIQGIPGQRFMYEECFGNIPHGMVVRHRCDNRACINPEHLELGTIKENMGDKKRCGTHPCGEKNHRHKLTWEQVREIRSLRGMSQSSIGRLFGVHRSTIEDVLSNRGWTHDEYGRVRR